MHTTSKALRLSMLLEELLHLRLNLNERFPIPTYEDPSQVNLEEGMVRYCAPYARQLSLKDVPLEYNVIISVPLKSSRAEATEHEEPILVTFLLMGYGTHSQYYRGIRELYRDGGNLDNERITLMGKRIGWLDITSDQYDELIWYVGNELQMWTERLPAKEPHPGLITGAAQQVRELSVAVDKMAMLDQGNPFLSMTEQTAAVFLEKINKQIEKAQERIRGDQA